MSPRTIEQHMNVQNTTHDSSPERQSQMTTATDLAMSRRSLLRTIGLVAASGGVLAACGDPIDKSATRIGEAPTTTALPEAKADDVVLLRTAMSMEYLVHDILSAAPVSGAFSKSPSPTGLFVPEHRKSIAALTTLVTARGGRPFDAANPKLMEVFGDDAISLVAVSDQRETDALSLAHALETLLASTYQNFVASTVEPALRAEMVGLGVRASRNAAISAQLIRSGVAAFAPALDENGNPLVATLPSAFGSLTNVQIAIGKPTETGARTQVTMDTPSLNSYVYSDAQ